MFYFIKIDLFFKLVGENYFLRFGPTIAFYTNLDPDHKSLKIFSRQDRKLSQQLKIGSYKGLIKQ